MRPLRSLGLLLVGGCLALAGCRAPSSDAGSRITVVAAFYPLQFAAQAVGGDAVDVTTLTQPGVEPHDLELSAAQVAQIAEADLVLYIKGFQPAVDEAIEQQAPDRAIDVAAGLDRIPGGSDGEAVDPHVWLNPLNMAAIGTAVASRIEELDPDASTAVAARAEQLAHRMGDLDQDYASGLARCAVRDMVVSHEAFGYLAAAYGLTQVGISGLSPDAEPSPARMKDVADLVGREHIGTIYYETLVDPKVAQTIADETGAAAAVLDPLEGLAADATGDYTSIMRSNLLALEKGQGCT